MFDLFQIVNKVHTELTFARFEMEKCLKHGGDVAAARKRVSYLEDRMEGILGKRKLRVSLDEGYNYSKFSEIWTTQQIWATINIL